MSCTLEPEHVQLPVVIDQENISMIAHLLLPDVQPAKTPLGGQLGNGYRRRHRIVILTGIGIHHQRRLASAIAPIALWLKASLRSTDRTGPGDMDGDGHLHDVTAPWSSR
jgi:hypothetical protein